MSSSPTAAAPGQPPPDPRSQRSPDPRSQRSPDPRSQRSPDSRSQPASHPRSRGEFRPRTRDAAGRRLRRLAAALVGAEAAGLLVLAGWVVIAGFVRDPASWVYVVWIAGLAFAAGIGLLLVARGLLAGRSWSRAPAVLMQLLVITVAYEPLQVLPAARWSLLALAVLTLVVVVMPAVYRSGDVDAS